MASLRPLKEFKEIMYINYLAYIPMLLRSYIPQICLFPSSSFSGISVLYSFGVTTQFLSLNDYSISFLNHTVAPSICIIKQIESIKSINTLISYSFFICHSRYKVLFNEGCSLIVKCCCAYKSVQIQEIKI